MSESDSKLMYPKMLQPWELEPYYCKHISAMTTEGLHSKHDIAKQLAWRDQRLEQARKLLFALKQTLPQLSFAPGEIGDRINTFLEKEK